MLILPLWPLLTPSNIQLLVRGGSGNPRNAQQIFTEIMGSWISWTWLLGRRCTGLWRSLLLFFSVTQLHLQKQQRDLWGDTPRNTHKNVAFLFDVCCSAHRANTGRDIREIPHPLSEMSYSNVKAYQGPAYSKSISLDWNVKCDARWQEDWYMNESLTRATAQHIKLSSALHTLYWLLPFQI